MLIYFKVKQQSFLHITEGQKFSDAVSNLCWQWGQGAGERDCNDDGNDVMMILEQVD